MGFFSWIKSDDGEPVRNAYTEQGPTPCKMLDNTGRAWVEAEYEGYGDFGGMDYYALVDLMNGGDGDRDRGIKLAFDGDEHPMPKIVSLECRKKWEDLPDSELDPDQGYF